MLPKYAKSSTESTMLPSTIIGDSVDPEPRFWSFVLVQETQRPNLEASSSIAATCESGVEAFPPCQQAE